MAQTKEQILNRITEYCNKGNFNFTAKSLEKFSEESVKLFDVENAVENDVYASLENQLNISFKMMSSSLAAAAETYKQEKTVLETKIAELSKQPAGKEPAPQPTPNPQTEKPDVAEELKKLGIDVETLKSIQMQKQNDLAKETTDAHRKNVIAKAEINVPQSFKEQFKKFSKFSQIQNSGNIDNDAILLNKDFVEFIKDSDDIDIEAGVGQQDEKAKYSNIAAAIERNKKA